MKLSWQQQLAQANISIDQLSAQLDLDCDQLANIVDVKPTFIVKATQSYIARIATGKLDDPLLRQILPLTKEQEVVAGYSVDPVGDHQALKQPGLIQKYHGRVLLTLSGQCAIHCRYCFRRKFPYLQNQMGTEQWQQLLTLLQQDPTIDEVIFSGGDPLIMSDRRLAQLMDDLHKIPSIKRIRFHTRLPIVLPDRITTSLLEILKQCSLPLVIVVHSNHPNELNEPVECALQQLRAIGVTLLNQAVLLAGVNNDAETLIKLQQQCFECGVLPYYLHKLDKVMGAAHFDVDEHHAQQLMAILQEQLPGYLVPRYVCEQPGRPSKTWL